MFKVIVLKRNGRAARHKNFHTLEAAVVAAARESERGRRVELCDMETSRLSSVDALHPNIGTMRRSYCG